MTMNGYRVKLTGAEIRAALERKAVQYEVYARERGTQTPEVANVWFRDAHEERWLLERTPVEQEYWLTRNECEELGVMR